MISLSLGVVGLAGLAAGDYTVPEGFAVERVADGAASFVALAFDPAGRVLASLEAGGLVWLADEDGDGSFESTGSFSDELAAVQGLCWRGDELFVSGLVGERGGLWRVEVAPDGLSAIGFELLVEVRSTGADSLEHGAHAVVAGPDGGLWWVLGDHAELVGPPDPRIRPLSGSTGSVLPVLPNPLGQAASVRYPAGHVVRVEPSTGAWWVHSTGLRNAYDLAFDRDGELFTFDSDMEWDVGLPWYRPVRFLHLVVGGEYGWRRGSAPWPAHRIDSLPPMAELGRGSPTGLANCSGAAFPPRYDDALLAGDWTNGRILAVFPEPRGASFGARVETLLQAESGLGITDLTFGPDGALYFVGGGRGTLGRLERLVYRGPLPSAEQRRLGRPTRSATWLHATTGSLAARSAELAEPDPVLRRRAAESLGLASELDEPARSALCRALDDRDRWVRFAARRALERHGVECTPTRRALSIGETERALLGLRTARAPEVPPLGDLGPRHSAEQWWTAVRVFSLACIERPELLDADTLERTGAAVLSTFPHADPRVAREQAELLVRLGVAGVGEQLVAQLGSDADRELRLHYARCLAALERGWTPQIARPALAFLEEALAWKGGESYAGYVEQLRDAVSAPFTDAQRVELARDVRGPSPIGARTLAAWIAAAAPAEVDAYVAPLQYAWGRLARELEGEPLRDARAGVLSTLAGARSEALAEFLRRQCDNPEVPHEEALAALARMGYAADFARLVEGLALPAPALREECVRALLAVDRAPESAAPFRTVLELAERLGPVRGRAYAQLFEHWSGGATPPAVGAGWPAVILHWERWAGERFPGFATEVDDTRRPAWEFERLVGFLERSAQRPGSAARGAGVFERASCGTCHVLGDVGGSDGGWGPDLGGVTRRFDRRSLLEAIVFPSRAVSDQHATTVVETTSGRVVEGRVLVDDETQVILLERGGRRTAIPRAEVADAWRSELSSMPDGLLAGSTLEEVKDLIAFLEADGRAAAPDGEDWTPLFDDAHRNLWEGDVELWKLRGGGLVGRSRDLEASAYLMSKTTWSDFELEFDVRLDDGAGNSGVAYRARPEALEPVGYQVDIGERYWGSLYASDGRGTIGAIPDDRWRDVVERGGWNHFHVRVEGERHVIEVNGERLVDLSDSAFRDGALGFQLHQGPAMTVRFQNARIRALR